MSATVAVAAGLFAVTVRVAVAALAVEGVNSTRTRQLEPGASVDPQLLA